MAKQTTKKIQRAEGQSLEDFVAERRKFHSQHHEDVYSIIVEDYYVILKPADRNVYSAAISLMFPIEGVTKRQDADIVGAGTKILQGCVIEGDEEIMSKPNLTASAAMQAIAILDIKEASLKKN